MGVWSREGVLNLLCFSTHVGGFLSSGVVWIFKDFDSWVEVEVNWAGFLRVDDFWVLGILV